MTSLASNEIFTFSIKIFLISSITLFILFFTTIFLDINLIFNNFSLNNEIINIVNLNSFINEDSISLNKLYNFPTNILTILLINYLFLTLIAVVKITNIFEGPLRPKY